MDMSLANQRRCFRGLRLLGSARVPRAGFGVAPKQAFLLSSASSGYAVQSKVRDREDALASTRDARATQSVRVGMDSFLLSQPEGSAAYNLAVDHDVHAIGADSQRAGTQIVYVLTAIDSEV